MKKIVLALILVLTVTSCNMYKVVILDKIKPNSIKPYPIRDTTANAVMFKFLDSDKIFWAREHINSDLYDIGDTVMCYFRINK